MIRHSVRHNLLTAVLAFIENVVALCSDDIFSKNKLFTKRCRTFDLLERALFSQVPFDIPTRENATTAHIGTARLKLINDL